MNLAVGVVSNVTFGSDFHKGKAWNLYESQNDLKSAFSPFKIAVVIPQ